MTFISVSKSVNVNNFGICIGEFQTKVLQIDSNSIYCFFLNDIKEGLDKTFLDGQLLQKSIDFFKGYLGLDIIKNFKLVNNNEILNRRLNRLFCLGS
jgi:hypothetical protein